MDSNNDFFYSVFVIETSSSEKSVDNNVILSLWFISHSRSSRTHWVGFEVRYWDTWWLIMTELLAMFSYTKPSLEIRQSSREALGMLVHAQRCVHASCERCEGLYMMATSD
jgi:hypothetical protein